MTLIFACASLGCHRETVTGETETAAQIRPATPPPSNPSETDTALTQTVEIGDDRSPEEGGVLSQQETASIPASSTAAKPPQASPAKTTKP